MRPTATSRDPCFTPASLPRVLWMLATLLLLTTPVSAAYYPNLSFGPKRQLVPGVTWQTATHASPRWSIQIIEVDMTNPEVAVVPVFKSTGNIVGSANQRTSTMAIRNEAVAAINAGFYATNLMTNSYTLIGGQFIGGSSTNMRPEHNRSVIGFSAPPQAIAKRTQLSSSFTPADPTDWDKITDAIAGRGHFVTANGVLVVQDDENTTEAHHGSRHPRTLIGYSSNPYKVWLVTVDGRQPNFSVGMTHTELGRLAADLGIEQSVSLDGGGSTTAWVRGQGVVNSLSDGSERPVVSAWAVVELSYSSLFAVGDWVRATAPAGLNLRSGPGTSFPVAGGHPPDTLALIRPDPANGLRADGHNWWRVKIFPGGEEGWWAEAFLDSAEPPALPPLRIEPGNGPGLLRLSWKSDPGVTYRLQHSADLNTWTTIGFPIVGSGGILALQLSQDADSRGFYRLISDHGFSQ